jgi:hypothetical protein
MIEQQIEGEKGKEGVDGKERAAIERLLTLARKASLLRAGDGRLFARVPVENRSEVYALKGEPFREWLVGEHFRETGALPHDGTIRRVIGGLEALARFGGRGGGGAPLVSVRVGGGDGRRGGAAYYIDLGDSSGHAIEISAGGWSIAEKPGVNFRSPGGQLALPVPSREGSIELLRPYVNLSQADFRLLVAWMAAALQPVGPYPILVLYGEQGSAKSTLVKVVRRLIDPQHATVLALPASTRDMMVAAVNGWLLAYDNISSIRGWLSDSLCVLATGGAIAGRALYSNDERSVIAAQRPVILSGIDEYVRRSDLSDRSVFLHLPAIMPDQRRMEEDFWHAFREDEPRIFGGLLDAIASGLSGLALVKLAELPRMADFAAFAEAMGRALGWGAETVLSDYYANRHYATAANVEDSLVACTIIGAAQGKFFKWRGTATEMLSELGKLAGREATRSPRWPKSPWWLTNELRRIGPELRTYGLSITFERTGGKRLIHVRNAIY